MIIKDNKKINEIQAEFNAKFPNLKIEFYKVQHHTGEGTSEKSKLDNNLTIGEIRTIHTSGDLSINGHQKVSTLENNFLTDYGLNIQVFRKSGSLWLQTTSTDNWTLSDQNERSKNSNIMSD